MILSGFVIGGSNLTSSCKIDSDELFRVLMRKKIYIYILIQGVLFCF